MLATTNNTPLYSQREKFGPFPEGALGKVKKGDLPPDPYQLVKVIRYRHCANGVLNFMCSEELRATKYRAGEYAILRQIISDNFLQHYYPTRPIRELREYLDLCRHDEFETDTILSIYRKYKTYFDFLREAQTLYTIKTARVCAASGGVKLSGSASTIHQKLKEDPEYVSFIETDNDCDYAIADLDPNFQEILSYEWSRIGLIPKYETGAVVSLRRDVPVTYYDENIECWSDDKSQLYRKDGLFQYKSIVVDREFISCSNDLETLRQEPEEIILSQNLRSAVSYGAGSLTTQNAYGRWYYRIRVDRSLLDPYRDRDIEEEYWVEENQISFAKPDYNAQVRDTIGVAMPKHKVGSYVTYSSPVGRKLVNTPFHDDYLLKLGINPNEIFKAGLGVVVGHAQIYSERSFREMVWGPMNWELADDEQLLPPWDELEDEDLDWSYPEVFSKQSFWMFFNPESEFCYGGIPSKKRARGVLMPIVCVLHPETLNPAFLAYIPERDIKQTVSTEAIAKLLEARKPEWAALDSVGILQQFEPAITGPILKLPEIDTDFF